MDSRTAREGWGAEPALGIRLFGPFTVQRHGESLPPLRSRKGEWLLALLSLRHGQRLERTWLAGTLWPESSESRALYYLRRELAQLRQALGPEATRLRTPTPHTLCLDVAGAVVDLPAFDAAIARGDAASLEEAISLYRGPLLEGCTEEWAFTEREARHQAYLSALETLATQAMARSEPAAVHYLRLAVAADPLRESAHCLLMQALAAGAEYAAATHVYRELRLLLHRELNADPSPETTALFHEIRARARQPTPAQRPTPAPGAVSPSQVCRLRFPPVQSRLPQPLTRLVGRESEVLAVKECMLSARLVTLTGSGGVGKSRLALQVAQELINDYPDGVWLVELASLIDPAFVLRTVASALGVREQPGQSLLQTLLDSVGERSLLLVLDNCEHLLEACAVLGSALVCSGSHVQILATSRQSLGLVGEVAWRVPSLAAPDLDRLPAGAAGEKERVSVLLEYPAIQLFVQRAREVQPSFRVTPQNIRSIAQISRLLDGIPLAIELAAARLKAIPVQQIPDRLEDCFRLLTGGSRVALPRHQTLRATMDWSYQLLSPAERCLLRRVSVFTGGFALAAAEEVCADPKRDEKGMKVKYEASPSSPLIPEEILDLLSQLVDKSLVLYEERDGEGRYGLLETVRLYSQDKLHESGEVEAVRQRHRDCYLRMAEAAHCLGAYGKQWLDQLEQEHDNLRAALEWAIEQTPELGLRLAKAVGPFWEVRGYYLEGRAWLERALARAPDAPAATRGEALGRTGAMAVRQGDYRRAKSLLEEGLRLNRQVGNQAAIAGALGRLGWIVEREGDYRTARALYDESLAIQRERADPYGIATALSYLGGVTFHQGDGETARGFYEESLAIWQDTDHRTGILWSLTGLGQVAHAQGDYVRARALYEEGQALAEDLGVRWNVAWSWNALGHLAYVQGDSQSARAPLEESLEIWSELGDKFGISWSLNGLGLVAYAEGDLTAARALFTESLKIRREIGQKEGIAYCLAGLAKVAWGQGRPAQGARLFGAVEALLQSMGAKCLPLLDRADCDRHIADIRAALGEDAFAVAWSAGASLPMEQAVVEAVAELER